MSSARPPAHPAAGRTVDELLEEFRVRCAGLDGPRVLELGTRRTAPGHSTRRDHWVPNAAEYLGTDLEAGVDVDIVADVHRLTSVTGEERFDVIISCSTFEHFKYPLLAAHEVMKALVIGGLVFVQTHQSFPIHSFPYDYFRFSREALESLFPASMGMRLAGSAYMFPATIVADRDPEAARQLAFLNVYALAEKVARTPETFVYELDS